MRIFRDLLSVIRQSVFSPTFYMSAQKEGVNRPVTLNAILGFIGSALIMLFLYAILVPFAFSNYLDKLASIFPDDLIVTVAHGQLSINKPQPYDIPNTLFSGGPKDLVIFDGDDTLKGDANANSTLVLVKKTYLLTASSGGQAGRVTTFDPTVATTTITKQDVAAIVGVIRPYWKPAIVIGGLFLLIAGAMLLAIFWLLCHLVYLLIPAALIFLYSRFNHPSMRWSEAYIVALYASLPVAILMFLIGHIVAVPVFLYTLVVMLIAIVNLSQMPNTSHQHLPQES